jgi:hypothetical protein
MKVNHAPPSPHRVSPSGSFRTECSWRLPPADTMTASSCTLRRLTLESGHATRMLGHMVRGCTMLCLQIFEPTFGVDQWSTTEQRIRSVVTFLPYRASDSIRTLRFQSAFRSVGSYVPYPDLDSSPPSRLSSNFGSHAYRILREMGRSFDMHRITQILWKGICIRGCGAAETNSRNTCTSDLHSLFGFLPQGKGGRRPPSND